MTTAPTAPPTPVIATDWSELYPSVAPSGAWMTYEANNTGVRTVYIAEFPSGRGIRQVARGQNPQWSRTGDRLYFLDAGNIAFVDVTTTPAFDFSEPRTLFPSLGALNLNTFVPSDSVDRFLINRSTTMNEALTVTIVQNWFAEFAARTNPQR